MCLRRPLWEGATWLLDLENPFWIRRGVTYEYIQIRRCAVTGLVLCAVPE